jgi:hypothetical protein
MEDLTPRREGRAAPERRAGAQVSGGGAARAVSGPGLDRHATDHIGERLRDYYVTLASEPLPAKIAELLERLDKPSAEA